MSEINFYGSLCLSDIPKEVIKKGSDGKMYLNIYVNQLKPEKFREHVDKNGKKHITTHYVRCAVPKDQQKEGVNYFFGNLELLGEYKAPTAQDIENAPAASAEDTEDLPF